MLKPHIFACLTQRHEGKTKQNKKNHKKEIKGNTKQKKLFLFWFLYFTQCFIYKLKKMTKSLEEFIGK